MHRFLRLFPCYCSETDHDHTTIETIIYRSTANPTGWSAATKARAPISHAGNNKTANPGAPANHRYAATKTKRRATINAADDAETQISLLPLTTRVDTDDSGHRITDHKLCSTVYTGKFAPQAYKH